MYCPACKSEYPDDWKRCPKDEAELLKTQFVGKYRVEEIIGTGGMGAVYKALNPDTNAQVAIKLMHAAAASMDAARARFQREAAAVSSLRTQHLVGIYDFGTEDDGTMYLVMEFLDGHNLRSEIKKAPELMPIPRIAMVAGGALRGLGAAHRAAVTHRDLKPENIFVANTDDGEVTKVLDFGIARVDTAEDQRNLTQSGALMGTPAYMAPEQIAGNRGEIGPWTDVYAMGCILYEMFTGQAPFHAETITAVLSRVLGRDFSPLANVRPDLPQPILDVIDRSIADDFRERFPHADGLREAWESAYDAFPADVKNATVPRFTRSHAAQSGTGSAPDASMATDWGSAPTVTPQGMMRPGYDGVPNRTAPTVDSKAHHQQNISVTPGPVVVENTLPAPGSGSKKGLWIGLVAVVLVGGGIAAAVTLGGGGDDDPDKPDKPVAGETVDAGNAVTTNKTPADAKAGTPAVSIDAAPPPPAWQAAMVRLEGGEFQMGTPGSFPDWAPDNPQHAVTVKPFWIDRTEFTVAMLKEALPKHKSAVGADPDMPAANVSWTDAAAACKALDKRLATEAEWEFAATRKEIDPKAARMRAKGVTGPAKAGTHEGDCSPEGVCDLLGNVAEWTADRWTVKGKKSRNKKLMTARGSSYSAAPIAGTYHASVHARVDLEKKTRSPELGFRCAHDDG
jgi:serine/threonine-protein kinase